MASNDNHVFAVTKLQAPALRPDALSRLRLVEAVRRGFATSRLTLVSAPAGSGKTSLLAELPHAFPEMEWAWLLLDEDDNDPSRFAAGVAAAVGVAGAGADLTLAREEAASGRQVMTGVVNKVAGMSGPVVLAIDDFHLIQDEATHRTLEYLLDRIPRNLRVILGTREEPSFGIARWRARGEVAEIRMDDLRMTEAEVAELVNSRLGLSLDAEKLRTLYSRTEGWAAGVRLMAASLASASGVGNLPEAGNAGRQRVFEFFSAEVLERQGAELKKFLTQTSVLSSLRAETCDLLTGRNDSRDLLENLYRQNLFVTAVDAAGTTYRYHDLFADFLRERLRRESSETWCSIHARAAGIETETNWRVRHLIAAGGWDEAAAEIVRVGPDYLRRGFAATLRRWIQDIPVGVRHAYPRLSLLLGTSMWVRSELSQAQTCFEEALAGFCQAGDEEGQGESLVALSITAIMFSKPEKAQELFERAVVFPLPDASRVELHAAAGWDALNRRDWPTMHRNLEHLLDLIAEPAAASSPFAFGLAIYGTSFPDFLNRLEPALARLSEGLESTTEFTQATYYALKAASLQFRGDLAGSRRMAGKVLAMAGGSEVPLLVRLSAMVTLLLTACSEGDWTTALDVSEKLCSEHSMAPFLQRWKPLAAYFLGRARWQAGDFAGVIEACERISTPEPEESPQPHVNRLLLQGIRWVCDGAWGRARESFEEAQRLQKTYRITGGSSSAATLLAWVHLKKGRPEEALEIFGPYLAEAAGLNGPGYILRENPIVIPLLRLAHSRGRHRTFAERCLGLLGAHLQAEERIGAEALSEREMEVLRVVAAGLSNREIGERLFVSEATVKTHVQKIMRKLDAASRTQAVARARELMLI